MCFGDIDHKTLMRETEERLVGVQLPSISPVGAFVGVLRKLVANRFVAGFIPRKVPAKASAKTWRFSRARTFL